MCPADAARNKSVYTKIDNIGVPTLVGWARGSLVAWVALATILIKSIIYVYEKQSIITETKSNLPSWSVWRARLWI